MMEGKFALVTGGAQGLGLAYVRELLLNGIEGVTLVDINGELGNRATDDLNQEFGEKVIFVQADVTISDQFEAAFKTSIGKWNFLDIVINNAGFLDDERWEMEILVNCTGTARGVTLAFQYMSKTKGGRGGIIINAGSIVSINPHFGTPFYSASKGYVTNLSRALGTPFYFDYTGVMVMAVCPGPTNTLMLDDLLTKGPLSIHPDTSKQMAVELTTFPTQSIETAAKAVIDIIKEGHNGSIWIVEGSNSPYEVEFSARQDMKKMDLWVD